MHCFAFNGNGLRLVLPGTCGIPPHLYSFRSVSASRKKDTGMISGTERKQNFGKSKYILPALEIKQI
jgi:hypothetical protein